MPILGSLDVSSSGQIASPAMEGPEELALTKAALRQERELRAQSELDSYILQRQHADAQTELSKVRNQPFKALTDKLKFRFLYRLLGSGLALSDKNKARFAKSARKRDPMRSLHDTATSHDRDSDYRVWMRTKEAKTALSADQIAQINAQAQQPDPLFSVIMAVPGPSPEHLEATLLSVIQQSFQNWQLCIAADASISPDLRALLEKYTALDSRIQTQYELDPNQEVSLKNAALKSADGTFIALLTTAGRLAPNALAHAAQAIQNAPKTRLIYSDEDTLNAAGERVAPHFKSGWNRDLFYTHNYIMHLSILAKSAIDTVDGFRPEFEGAEDYDLLLRAISTMADEHIIHLPKVLYHRQAADSNLSQAHRAGKKALAEFLQRQENADIIVADGMAETFYRVIWPLPDAAPKVTLVIPTRDYKDLLETAVTSILEKTDYQNYDIIIVDNGSVEPETLAWFDTIQQQHSQVRVLRYDEPFNYSAINNFAVAQTDASIIGLINNDIEVVNPGWLREMVSHAIRDDIGCVGAKLHYTSGQIQHGGVIIGIGWMAGHSHKHYHGTHRGYFGRLIATQNLSAVTGACLVLKRSLYNKVNGLDADHLAIAFNDIDLCLKVQAEGCRNLWSPYATLFHHESISRGHEDTPEKHARYQKEASFMTDKWDPDQNPDPYYNPNLTLEREDFSIDISQ